MGRLFAERMTGELDGDFVVFLIGLRINKPWMVHKWLPVFLAMPRMIKELKANPELGFLGCEIVYEGVGVEGIHSGYVMDGNSRSNSPLICSSSASAKGEVSICEHGFASSSVVRIV